MRSRRRRPVEGVCAISIDDRRVRPRDTHWSFPMPAEEAAPRSTITSPWRGEEGEADRAQVRAPADRLVGLDLPFGCVPRDHLGCSHRAGKGDSGAATPRTALTAGWLLWSIGSGALGRRRLTR
jgi:hypothetical protein